MLFSRRTDDADVIRARLRALLEEGGGHRGWLPDDHDRLDVPPATEPWADDEEDPDSWSLGPDEPAAQTPAAQTPAAQTPAAQTPAAQTPAAQTPAALTPAEQPAPARPDAERGRHRAAGPATRVDPGRHGTRALWVAALVAAVVVAGGSWLSRPEVAPVDAAAPAVPAASTGSPAGTGAAGGAPPTTGAAASSSAGQIVVAVVGQVVSPGVVTLPAGARVADALAAAGGLLPEADPASINQAALLADGQQVAVGVPGAATPAGAGAGSGSGSGGGLVDLNAAGPADLDALPGIGPVLAQRIIDHRTEHGPFTSVEQLDDVSGIGPSLYAEIAPLVTV